MLPHESRLGERLLTDQSLGEPAMARECVHVRPRSGDFVTTVATAKGCVSPKCAFALAPDYWVCLTCGFCGCGRNGDKHALDHATSKQHPVVMQLCSSMIWCYECDAELLGTDTTSEAYKAILQGYRECVRPGQKAEAKPAASGAGPMVSPASKRLTNDARMPMLVLYPATAGLTGLGNLGNTCFFNAAVQALSNVPPLATFFSEVSFASQQVRQDSVANAFKLLMMDIWYRSHHGVSSKTDTMDLPSLAPSGLLRALKQANPIFEGYQQQDAHEALRTLLNEMHEKLAVEVPIGLYQRGSRGGSVPSSDPSPYNAASDVGVGFKRRIARGEHEKPDSDDSDGEARQLKPGRSSQRRRHSRSGVSQHEPPEDNHGPKWLVEGPYTGPETVQRSIISDLFQGIYCSRVRCSVCSTDSLTYDTFYDLSLPIPRYQHDLSRGSDGSAHSARAMAWAAEASRDCETYPEGFDLHQSSPRPGVTVANAMRKVVAEDASSPLEASATPAPALTPEAAADPHSNWFVSALSKVFCSIRGPGRGFGFGDGIGLADCLFSFFDWEDLKGADQYFCETCNKKQDAIKKISIVSLPEVLCIHLKRFSYHGWNGSKNSAGVAFPLSGLDLSPFLGASAHPGAVKSYIRAKEQQIGARLQHLLNPKSLASGPRPLSSKSLSKTGSKRSTVAPETGSAKGASTHSGPEAADDAFTISEFHDAGLPLTSPLSTGRRVVTTLNPETRALILHRHAIATGGTGVDAISAAAAAAAGVGLHLAIMPSRDAAVHASAMAGADAAASVAAAAQAASETIRAFEAASRMTPDEIRIAAADHPVPIPVDRVCSSISMGDSKYDCVASIQHMGGLSGGHYIAHAKNRTTGKWYTFDDSSVFAREAADVQRKEAYVLFYTRQPSKAGKFPLPAAGKDEPTDYYVSRYWWTRYSFLAVPGPVSNSDILCDHGSIKNQLSDAAATYVVPVTRRQYEALALRYGASDKPLRTLSPCTECEYEARMLQVRRQRERDQIVAVDTTSLPAGEGSVWYLMSEWWLTRWRAFINSEGVSDGTGRGVLPPGPVDNARLLGKDGKPLPNLRAATHYRGVNANVWNFLHSIYGGGPMLRRKDINVYLEPV